MWTNLVAGIFNIPTLTNSYLSIDGRIKWLRSAIKELEKYRNEQILATPSPRWNNNPGGPKMIFVAPEYMFVSTGFKLMDINDLTKNRFLSRGERDQIVAELQKISIEYGKDLIFVPGSIAYQEELPTFPKDRMERIEIAKLYINTAAEKIEKRFTLPSKSHLDTRLASPLGGVIKGISPREKITELENAKNDLFYTATNIVYMFTNGKIIASYAKRSDYHERLPHAPKNTVFVPGIKPGRATVGGINFGIEICLDHALGVLSNTPTITGDLPRVHLICSATVELKPASVLMREGGYLIHASSKKSNAGIFRKLGGVKAIDNPKDIYLNGWNLQMGVIELDI